MSHLYTSPNSIGLLILLLYMPCKNFSPIQNMPNLKDSFASMLTDLFLLSRKNQIYARNAGRLSWDKRSINLWSWTLFLPYSQFSLENSSESKFRYTSEMAQSIQERAK